MTTPDRPGDRDRQQAAEMHAEWLRTGQRWPEMVAAALAAARAEEAARWRAKIEALIAEHGVIGVADLPALLDGGLMTEKHGAVLVRDVGTVSEDDVVGVAQRPGGATGFPMTGGYVFREAAALTELEHRLRERAEAYEVDATSYLERARKRASETPISLRVALEQEIEQMAADWMLSQR